jgi:hypothetical protein
LAELADALQVNVYLSGIDEQLVNYLTSGALKPEESANWVLRLPILENPYFDDPTKVGVGLFLLPETAAAKPGFALLPYGSGKFEEDINLTDDLVLKVAGGMDLDGGVGILVRPGQAIQVKVDIIPAGGKSPSAGVVAIALETSREEDSKTLLIGSEDGSRFEIGSVSLKVGTRVDSLSKNDVYTELECKNAAIVIKPGSGEAVRNGSACSWTAPLAARFSLGGSLSEANASFRLPRRSITLSPVFCDWYGNCSSEEARFWRGKSIFFIITTRNS